MARILHICNTLQKSKYLKTGNFLKFLSVKIRIYSKLSIQQDQDHPSTQLYMPEPDVPKNSHLILSFFLSFFLSFSFPGLTLDSLDLSPWFSYKSTLFCSAQCSGSLVLRYPLYSHVMVGVYDALMIGGVSDTPFLSSIAHAHNVLPW